MECNRRVKKKGTENNSVQRVYVATTYCLYSAFTINANTEINTEHDCEQGAVTYACANISFMGLVGARQVVTEGEKSAVNTLRHILAQVYLVVP